MKNHPSLNSFLIFALFGLVLLTTFSKRGYLDLTRMKSQNREMKKKIEQSLLQKSRMEKKLEALSDPIEQERLVRQILGYVHPNESIIELE